MAVVVGIDTGLLYLNLRNKNYNNSKKVFTNNHFSLSKNPSLNKIYIIFFCFLSAFWEEVIFRGIPFLLASKFEMSLIVVIFLSSVLFAMHHFSGGEFQIIYSFFYGILFSLLFVITGDLIAVFLSHAIGNLFVILIVIPLIKNKAEKKISFLP